MKRVISGGQTGADMAGLLVAQKVGLETGGSVPPNFNANLAKQFGLSPIKGCASIKAAYVARTMRNVDDADATIVFRKKASSGTDHTIGYALTGKWEEPKGLDETLVTQEFPRLLIVHQMTPEAVDTVIAFLEGVETLNVAGHRAGKGGLLVSDVLSQIKLTHCQS